MRESEKNEKRERAKERGDGGSAGVVPLLWSRKLVCTQNVHCEGEKNSFSSCEMGVKG